MKFELADGSIVSQEEMFKQDDCGCVIHGTIPHWIYMDDLIHSMNRKYIEHPRTNLALLAFATEEKARLAELGYQMKVHKVARIIREE